MPYETGKSLSWKNIARPCAFLAYQVTRFVLVAVFSLPVALVYVISALLLDPSLPEASKQRLPQLLIDRFEQVFHYGITLAILLSFGILWLLILKGVLKRLTTDASGSAAPKGPRGALNTGHGPTQGHGGT